MRWAIVDANRVSNVVVWDGTGDIFSGMTLVQLSEGEWCAPGCVYDPEATPGFSESPEESV